MKVNYLNTESTCLMFWEIKAVYIYTKCDKSCLKMVLGGKTKSLDSLRNSYKTMMMTVANVISLRLMLVILSTYRRYIVVFYFGL